MSEKVMLTRVVQATRIPEGDTELLEPGQPATLVHELGGHYTISLAADNRKFRIDGKDGDAIGKPVVVPADPWAGADPLPKDEALEACWSKLKQIHDPEIPVDIVSLGLVYEVKLHERGDGLFFAQVTMSLTSPGCGIGDLLIRDVERNLRTVPGVDTVQAEISFNPVWNPNMMSTAAKLKLGIL